MKDRYYDLVYRALVRVQHRSQRTYICRDAYVDSMYIEYTLAGESFLHHGRRIDSAEQRREDTGARRAAKKKKKREKRSRRR